MWHHSRIHIVSNIQYISLMLNIFTLRWVNINTIRVIKNWCKPLFLHRPFWIYQKICNVNICQVIFVWFMLLTEMQENFLKPCVLLTTLLKTMKCHYYFSCGTYVRGKVCAEFGPLRMVHKNAKSLVVLSSLASRLPRNLEVYTVTFCLYSAYNEVSHFQWNFSVMDYGRYHCLIFQSEFIWRKQLYRSGTWMMLWWSKLWMELFSMAPMW